MYHLLLTLILAQANPHEAALAEGPAATDLSALSEMLGGQGLPGRMHADLPTRGIYVFTYRTPGNFFEHAEFPVVPGTDIAAKFLANLKRHDAIRIWGSFIDNGASQKHIRADRIEVIAYAKGLMTSPPREDDLAELFSQTEAVVKVHAVIPGGGGLVFEYKNTVAHAVVADEHLTDGLYRGDKVRIAYAVAKKPMRPPHLALKGIVVLKRIADGNGQPIELEGSLVYFPKSPQLKFPVYALQTVDEDGVRQEYTLVNFSDPEIFQAILKKLCDAWVDSAALAVDGRNKLVNPHVRVHAKGTLNVQDPAQANPQILLTSPGQIKLTRQ